MPYIKQEERLPFNKILDQISVITSIAELKYCIVKLMTQYMCEYDFSLQVVMSDFDIENKNNFDHFIDQFPKINSKGQLEYCVYKLMLIYMKDKEYRYSNLHTVTYAAIDCGNEFKNTYKSLNEPIIDKIKETAYAVIHCGDEFRRRLLDMREDGAIKENGDII